MDGVPAGPAAYTAALEADASTAPPDVAAASASDRHPGESRGPVEGSQQPSLDTGLRRYDEQKQTDGEGDVSGSNVGGGKVTPGEGADSARGDLGPPRMSGVPTPPGYVWDEKTKKWVKKDKDSLLSRTTEVLKDGAKTWVDPRRLKPTAEKINRKIAKKAKDDFEGWKENTKMSRRNMQDAKDAITKAKISLGTANGVRSGDILDKQREEISEYDPEGPAILYINGMNTPDREAKADTDAIMERCGYRVARVENNSHLSLLGDSEQARGEELGEITLSAQRTAAMIRKGIQEKGEIYVVAHSQGSAVFERALELLTPEEKSKIHYQGFGPQKYIDQRVHGLAEAHNVRHESDPVPYVNYARTGAGLQEPSRNWEVIKNKPRNKNGEVIKNPKVLDYHNFRETYVDTLDLPTKGIWQRRRDE